jgi:hypothetical protein
MTPRSVVTIQTLKHHQFQKEGHLKMKKYVIPYNFIKKPMPLTNNFHNILIRIALCICDAFMFIVKDLLG